MSSDEEDDYYTYDSSDDDSLSDTEKTATATTTTRTAVSSSSESKRQVPARRTSKEFENGNNTRTGECKLTFQPTSASTYPKDHLLDSGRPFNARKGYCWSINVCDTFRDRRAQHSNRLRNTNVNEVDACIVHFQPGAAWNIELGPGEWIVTIRCGDACYPSTVSLDVNNREHRLMGLQLRENEFYNWTFTTAKNTSSISIQTMVGHTEHKRNWTRIVSFQAVNKLKNVALKGQTLFKNSLRTATSAAEAPKFTGLLQRDWVRDVEREEKQAEWRAQMLRLKYPWKRASIRARKVATANNLHLLTSSSSSSSSSSSNSSPPEPKADETKVRLVCDMGFPRNHAVLGLAKKDNSVEAALEWLLSNTDALPPAEYTEMSSSSESGSSKSNNDDASEYGSGLGNKNVGRRRAPTRKNHQPNIVEGRVESVSGERYDAVQAREGIKHHADNSSLIQVLPDIFLEEGTMIVQTLSKEATQNVEERQQLDLGCAALALRVARPANVYVAVDHRLAEAETLPMWLLNDGWEPVRDEVIAVSHSEIQYFVLFVKYISERGTVSLGASGALMGYLPYFCLVRDVKW